MMQRWRSHIVVALLALTAGFLARPALSPRGTQLPASGEGAGVLPDTEAGAEPQTVIVAVDTLPRAPGLILDSASADLTGDGHAERIELFAQVQRDPRGRLMWDDGQRWMLVVHRGSRMHPILDRFVQLGHVRFWAIEQSGDAPPLLVQITTGSGIELQAYAYDAARDGFILVERLQSSGNVVHATPHTAF